MKRPLSLGSLHDRDEADTAVAPPNTHYGGLGCRLTNIPKIDRVRKIAHKGVKKAFLALANGKFVGKCQSGEGILTLTIEADDDEDLPPSLKGVLLEITVGGYVPGKPVTDELPGISAYRFSQSYTKEFANGLSPEHKDVLFYRCLHHFLRNYGNKVARVSFEAFYRATKLASACWFKNQEYGLALDIAMVRADVAIRQNQSNTCIGICFNSVGEQLEANGKYEDAAKIYMQMTTLYFKHSNEEMRATGYVNAGLAYKYAGDLDLAEQCYVNSWHLASHLAFEDPSFSCLINNMLALYGGCSSERKRNCEVNTGKENLHLIFCALLKTAGCRNSRVFEQNAMIAETSWLRSNLQNR